MFKDGPKRKHWYLRNLRIYKFYYAVTSNRVTVTLCYFVSVFRRFERTYFLHSHRPVTLRKMRLSFWMLQMDVGTDLDRDTWLLILLKAFAPALVSSQIPNQVQRNPYSGLKRSEGKTDRSILSIIEFKNAWKSTSTPSYSFITRTTFSLTS
jgi:hypothetical protein